MTSLLLVHDFGPLCGLGHRSRMRALQLALAERGMKGELTTTPVTGAPLTADVLVIDSYRTRADDRSRYLANVVAAVDDLQRDLAVDLVVDPNPGGAPKEASAGRSLCGARFALIPPLDRAADSDLPSSRRRVLVTTGGGETGALGLHIARAIAALRSDVDVRVVIGASQPAADLAQVTVLRDVPSLGPEILRSDTVVTAGGVTMLESLHAGRPTVAVVVADNQRRAVEGAVSAGAAVVARPEDAAEVVAELLDDPKRRSTLAETAAEYVDGQGADRVAEAILDLL